MLYYVKDYPARTTFRRMRQFAERHFTECDSSPNDISPNATFRRTTFRLIQHFQKTFSPIEIFPKFHFLCQRNVVFSETTIGEVSFGKMLHSVKCRRPIFLYNSNQPRSLIIWLVKK